MKTLLRKTLTAVAFAIGFTTAATAATPVAVWDGDFSTATQGGYTLSLKSNGSLPSSAGALALAGDVLKIDKESATEAYANGAIVVKYSNYAANATLANTALASAYIPGKSDDAGARAEGGILKMYYGVMVDLLLTASYGSYVYQDVAVPASGYMIIAYNAGSGTAAFVNDAVQPGWKGGYNGGIKWSGSTVQGFAIGGPRNATPASTMGPCATMTIESVALFADYDAFSLAGIEGLMAYKFPSELAPTPAMSLGFDNGKAASTILGGTAPTSFDDWGNDATYTKVRGSDSNYALTLNSTYRPNAGVPSGLTDNTSWSIHGVMKLAEVENGVLFGLSPATHSNCKYIGLEYAGNNQVRVSYGSGKGMANKQTLIAPVTVPEAKTAYHSYLLTFDASADGTTSPYYTLYIDGVKAGDSGTAARHTGYATRWCLGNYFGGASETGSAIFTGAQIDDFAIWATTCLTAVQAKDLASKFPVYPPLRCALWNLDLQKGSVKGAYTMTAGDEVTVPSAGTLKTEKSGSGTGERSYKGVQIDWTGFSGKDMTVLVKYSGFAMNSGRTSLFSAIWGANSSCSETTVFQTWNKYVGVGKNVTASSWTQVGVSSAVHEVPANGLMLITMSKTDGKTIASFSTLNDSTYGEFVEGYSADHSVDDTFYGIKIGGTIGKSSEFFRAQMTVEGVVVFEGAYTKDSCSLADYLAAFDTTPATYAAEVSGNVNFSEISNWNPAMAKVNVQKVDTFTLNNTADDATVTFDHNLMAAGLAVTSEAGKNLSLAAASGKTATFSGTYDFSGANGKATLGFSTGTSAVTAGKDTVITQTGTGALTVGAGNKATFVDGAAMGSYSTTAGSYYRWNNATQATLTDEAAPRDNANVIQSYGNAVVSFAGDTTRKLLVEAGDNVTINKRSAYYLQVLMDVRGGTLTFDSSTRQFFNAENNGTMLTMTGGLAQYLGTNTTDSKDNYEKNLTFGWSERTLYVNISGGTLSVPNAYLQGWEGPNYTVTGTGKIVAKGIWRKNGQKKVTTFDVNNGGEVSVGAYGLAAGAADKMTFTLNAGGILSGYEAGAFASQPIALGGAATMSAPAGVTFTVSGAVSGEGALTKAGEGEVVLSGENTYSGATTVSAGTLKLTGTTFGAGNVSVAEGATFDIGMVRPAGMLDGASAGTVFMTMNADQLTAYESGEAVSLMAVSGDTFAGTVRLRDPNGTEVAAEKSVAGGQLMASRPQDSRVAPFKVTNPAEGDWTAANWLDSSDEPLQVRSQDWAITVDATISNEVGQTATLTADRAISLHTLSITNAGTLALSAGEQSITATAIDDSASTGRTTLDFATGTANITAGADTVVAEDRTGGTLTIGEGKKATLADGVAQGTVSIASAGTLRYEGARTSGYTTVDGATNSYQNANIAIAVSGDRDRNMYGRVGVGDRLRIYGSNNNDANAIAWNFVNDGGTLIFATNALNRSTWYGRNGRTFVQTAGVTDVESCNNSGTGSTGFLLNYEGGSGSVGLAVAGGSFYVTNTVLRFGKANAANVTVSGGLLKVKGIKKANTSTDIGGTIAVSGGTLAIGGIGMANGIAAFTMTGGELNAYETTTIDGEIAVDGNIVVSVDAGKVLTISGNVTGDGTITKRGDGELVFRSDYRKAVTVEGGTIGYTVSVNDVGTFTVPGTCDMASVKIYNYGGQLVPITATEGRTVTFTWTITDKYCWWDYEFNGNVQSTGSDTTTMQNEGTTPYYNDTQNPTALWVGHATHWRDAEYLPEFTAVIYGKIVNTANQLEIGFGSTTRGSKASVSIACGNPDNNEVLLLVSQGSTVKKTVTMSVPNAYTADHLYAFVCKTVTVDDEEKTKVIVYLDGTEWDSFTFDSKVTLGGGFQIGSVHGGVPTGYDKATTVNANSFLDFLRVYPVVMDNAAMTAYANEYPYHSQNGNATRTFAAATATWTATGAWEVTPYQGETVPGDKPPASAIVAIDASMATEVTFDLAEAAGYEQFKVQAGHAITLRKGGTVQPTVSGLTTVAEDLTVDYDAIRFGNVMVSEGKTLTFDFTDFPFGNYYRNDTYDLTGMPSGAGAFDAIIPDLEGTGRSAALGINPNSHHYELQITVDESIPFVVTVDGSGNSQWSWNGGAMASEPDWTKATSGIIEKKGVGEATLLQRSGFDYIVTAGTLKFSSVYTTAQTTKTITVKPDGTFDMNGLADGWYNFILAGGALVNNGEDVSSTARQITSIALTANSRIGGTGNFGYVSSSYGANTLNLGGFTLTKEGTGAFYLCNTTVDNGTMAVNAGTLSRTADGSGGITFAANASLALGANGAVDIAGGKALSVGAIAGNGGTINNAGTISAFALTGTATLAGAGTYGTITLVDDAVANVGQRRSNLVTFDGSGTVDVQLTAAEDKYGTTVNVCTFAPDSTAAIGTVKDSAGATIPPERLDIKGGAVTYILHPTVFTVTGITKTAQTNFNGSAVQVAYSNFEKGDYETVTFKLTVGGENFFVDAPAGQSGTLTFHVSDTAAAASNLCHAVVSVVGSNPTQAVVAGKETSTAYSNTAWLYQGAPVAGTPTGWFSTSATGTTLNEEGGAWDATSPHVKPTAKDSKILIEDDEDTGLYNDFVFTPGAAPQAGQATVIDMDIAFDAAQDDVTSAAGAQAAIRLVTDGTDATKYRFAAFADGVWKTDTTIEAALGTSYPIRITLDYRQVPATVTYAVKDDGVYQPIASGVSGTTKSALANVTFNGTGKLALMTGSNVVDSVDASLVEDGEHNKYANVDQALKSGKNGLTLLWDASWDPSQMLKGNWTINANGHKLYTSTEGVKIDFNGTSYTVIGDYWEVANLLFGATSVTTNKFMYFTNALALAESEDNKSYTNFYLLRDVTLPANVKVWRNTWFNGEDRILSGATPTFAQGNPTFTIEGGLIGFAPAAGFSLKGGRFTETSKSAWNAYLADKTYQWAQLATPVRTDYPDYIYQPVPEESVPGEGEQLLPVTDANGEAVSVVVSNDWAYAVTGNETDPVKQSEKFSVKQGNGLTYLDNAVLGLANSPSAEVSANNIPVITPHQSSKANVVTFSLGNVNQKSITDSGARVKYRVYKSDNPGGKDGASVEAASPSATVEMPLPQSGVQYYIIEVDTGAVK